MTTTPSAAGGAAGSPVEVVRALRAAVAAAVGMQQRLAREFGVNLTDLAAVEHLSRSGTATPTELAHRLGLSPAAVTFAIDRLTEQGHVARTPHPTDRRKTLVELEPATVQRMGARMRPIGEEVMQHVRDLDDHDRAVVLRFLQAATEVYDGVARPGSPTVEPASGARDATR